MGKRLISKIPFFSNCIKNHKGAAIIMMLSTNCTPYCIEMYTFIYYWTWKKYLNKKYQRTAQDSLFFVKNLAKENIIFLHICRKRFMSFAIARNLPKKHAWFGSFFLCNTSMSILVWATLVKNNFDFFNLKKNLHEKKIARVKNREFIK